MENDKKSPAYYIISVIAVLGVLGWIYYARDKEVSEPEVAELEQVQQIEKEEDTSQVATTWFSVNTPVGPKAEITLLSPKISSNNEQTIEPGKLEIKWESTNVEKVIISVIEADGSVLVSSGPVVASDGSYIINIPDQSKKDQTKYRIAIVDVANGVVINSHQFTIKTEDN